jgi:DNA mismatch repair protein MutL
MAKIHELPANLTNQIAAGEVIERPASVVKELCENAIDAGAHRIIVSFEDAGLRQIRVQDDGSGIDADQLDLAFRRHATSKISTERDLFQIHTLGFRGEALASIAAVSKDEIVTNSGQGGVSAQVVDGQPQKVTPAAAGQGTVLTIKDLFYNTPARLKYLKSPRTEILRIVDVCNRLALGHPEIAFELKNGDRTLLKTAGNGNLRQVFAQIYGVKTAESMRELHAQSPDFQISGLVSDPSVSRASRNYITFLLNGRYVRSFQLTQAVTAGLGNRLPAGRYPLAVIAIKLDPLLVDVNVHPTKREVRLSKESELSRLLTQAVAQATTQQAKSPDLFQAKKPKQYEDQLALTLNEDAVNTKRPVEQPKQEVHIVSLDQVQNNQRYLITASWEQTVAKQQTLGPFGAKPKMKLPQLDLLGQVGSYVVAKNGDSLFLADPVAGARRLAYDDLLSKMQGENSPQQTLLTPLTVELDNSDYLQLKDHLVDLQAIGLFIEDFGQQTVLLQSVPVWLTDESAASVQKIILAFLHQAHFKITDLREILAQELTKNVRPVRSTADLQKMLQDLAHSSDPYYDQNGATILLELTKSQLNHLFKKDR